MSRKPPRSHFSPVFANAHWADESRNLTCFMRDAYEHRVVKETKGLKAWARRRGLYKWIVEEALDQSLETHAAPIYEKLCRFEEVTQQERIIWAQFLLSQIVRTPTYIRYENEVHKRMGSTNSPLHDRVGCLECMDLACITSRDWCFLLAHPDDHFVRSDNPVLLSGFIEHAETCLFYPLSPRVCFVACSMPSNWVNEHPTADRIPASFGQELEKGSAWAINFHIARAANESLVLHPSYKESIAEAMFGEILGTYPQPPFSLHSPLTGSTDDAFESIRLIMSAIDRHDYPVWRPFELSPFYRNVPNNALAT